MIRFLIFIIVLGGIFYPAINKYKQNNKSLPKTLKKRVTIQSMDTTYSLSPVDYIAEEKVRQYVMKYDSLAVAESNLSGIPASIIMAQALIESNAGQSVLALKNKNHFGIKCFSRTCPKGHCSNFSDDHHKDFFRNFSSVSDSYKEHTVLLKKPRYAKLYNYNDYTNWAKGLQACGYATDTTYARKLINMIELNRLYLFDNLKLK